MKNNKSDENNNFDEEIDTPCFNCGNVVTMSLLKSEAMEQTGQEVYCKDCDEDLDEDSNFVPFFE